MKKPLTFTLHKNDFNLQGVKQPCYKVRDDENNCLGVVNESLLPYLTYIDQIDKLVDFEYDESREHIFQERVDHLLSSIRSARKRVET